MSANRLLLVDDSPVPWWQFWRADPWWEAVADLESAGVVDFFDAVEKVRSVEQAMRTITAHAPQRVQIWGHGSPGRPLINGKPLLASDARWSAIGRTLWFRSCSVAQGARGIRFMEEIASRGVDVAAHLSLIGGLGHSNLVGVRAGGRAFWRATAKPKGSGPLEPRTVFPVELELPAWAFTERA